MQLLDPVRVRIEHTLALISDREAQLRYQRQEPTLEVSTELLLQWEDEYRPASAYFCAAFDSAQLTTLHAFHRTFIEVRELVGITPPVLHRWIEMPTWSRYRNAARAALESIRSSVSGTHDPLDRRSPTPEVLASVVECPPLLPRSRSSVPATSAHPSPNP